MNRNDFSSTPTEYEASLSPYQRRLWRLVANDPLPYRARCALRADGDLDISALDRALKKVIAGNEIMRMGFGDQIGRDEPVVRVLESDDSSPFIGIAAERSTIEDVIYTRGEQNKIDIEHGLVTGSWVTPLGPDSNVIVLCTSAMCMDRPGMSNLIGQWVESYGRVMEDQPIKETALQYADLISALGELAASKEAQGGHQYWRDKLRSLHLSSGEMSPSGTNETYRLNPRLSEGVICSPINPLLLKKMVGTSLTLNGDLSTLCFAAWRALIRLVCEEATPVIGLACDMRHNSGWSTALGLLTAHLPVSVPDNSSSFEEIVRATTSELLLTRKWQWIFRDDFAANICFDYGYEFEERPEGWTAGDVRFTLLEQDVCLDRFRVRLVCVRQGERLWTEFHYDRAEVSETEIGWWAERFERLLREAIAEPGRAIGELDIVGEREREQLISSWNASEESVSDTRWLHDQVTARAVEHPEDCAVSCGAESVSYLELERRSNQMAHVLRSRGVGRDSRVGLCANRSAEAVVGILGILRAGAAYVPLDPGYPSERLRYMLEDSGASVVLTTKQLAGVLVSSVETLALDDPAIWSEAPVTAPEVDIEPGQLAYVIYTSGSTGRPKGVAVTHANLQHSTAARETVYGDAAPRYLLLSSLSFDSSVAGLFWTLSRGGTLHLPADGAHADADAIAALIEHNRITHMLSLPSLYSVVLRAAAPEGLAALRVVIVAGEACPAALLRAHEATLPQAAIFNEYGPTEATVWCTVYQHRAGEQVADPVPIGRPIPRAPVYALDRWMKPAPAGVPGELYIGGDGISRGYIGQPALTAERFVPDPFAANPGARLYRTGDRGRWRRDRQIEFLGRADGQVKLRGFRIELGEVEAAIRDQEGVADAAVAVRGEPGSEQLVAYWVARDAAAEPTALETTIRAALAALMPAYMVPGRWVALNALPTTPNGKLDRNALPAPTDPSVQDDIHQTPIEELVAGIWSDVLVRPSIGRNDNFFALGGHSLSATQVVSRIRAAFAVDITLPLFFEAPTVAGLAEQIEQLQRTTEGLVVPPIVPVPRDRPLPLSFAQQRLWFLDQLHPGNPFYNVSASVRLSGELDIEALAHALQTLVDRHESLRTRFDILNDEPVQIIEPILKASLQILDLTKEPSEKRESAARNILKKEAAQPFKLQQGPIFRATIVRLGEYEHELLLSLHHIVADGWSMGLLIEDLTQSYDARAMNQLFSPRPLPLQYADFAVWQRNYLKGEVLDAHLHYWRNQLKDAPTLLLFPTDRPRPTVQQFRGSSQSRAMREGIRQDLERIAQTKSATLFMVLLAGFQALLHCHTTQLDIIIGTNVANRNLVDTERVVGFFLNQLMIRADLSGDPTFSELLMRVRKVTLEAYAHQDLPLDLLVADLQPERNSGHSPLYQVLFTLHNEPMPKIRVTGLTVRVHDLPSNVSKFDFAMLIEETDSSFVPRIEYDTELFERKTVSGMLEEFESIIDHVISNPNDRLSHIQKTLRDRHDREVAAERERLSAISDEKLHRLAQL